MSDADSIIKRQEQLASGRTNWDSWWNEIALRVLPSQATFLTDTVDQGVKRMERLFDSTAASCLERFSAVMDDLLTPRTQVWSVPRPADDELADNQQVSEYFEAANKVLFEMRYRPRANCASQKHMGYQSLGAFGNSCVFVDEVIGQGARYKHIHMKEIFWAENHQGAIDTLYRKFQLQGRQALQVAKEQNWDLPAKIIESANKNPYDLHWFIHCVQPNEERREGNLDYTGMPWASFYVALEAKQVVSSGGYTSWPYAIGRYMLAPGETYARSPAMSAWPAILTLNEEKKTVLRAGQLDVNPPILLTEDGALTPFSLKPGALNHGLVSEDGTPLAVPFKTGANVPLGLELMGLEKMSIEDSFLVTIFKVLIENPQMTATQVLEIAQQKAILLAPAMGRQHSEDLGPMIDREFDIASKAGLLPQMPDILRERGGEYRIEYRSPLARAMRAQDGVAILRTLEAAPAAISMDKNAAAVLDFPAMLRELSEINGVPAKLVRDEARVAQILDQQRQEEQQAAMAAMAPDASQASLNAAKAEQIRSGAA